MLNHIKKNQKRFDVRSSKFQNYVSKRLNTLCNFLEEQYYINSGGCCFVAYCIAEVLESSKIDYKLEISGPSYKIQNLTEIEAQHHYFIKVGNNTINQDDWDSSIELRVSSKDIIKHYSDNLYSWNDTYDLNNNKLIEDFIKLFYKSVISNYGLVH